MISVKGIKKSYAKVMALKGVDFKIEQGEIFLILGPNGAGKTTLIKLLLGFLFPDKGEIEISDDIKIGYMQEEKFGKDDWSVEKSLRYVGELNGLKKNELTNRVDSMLEKFQIKKKNKTKLKELSKGLRQRVKCAQAALCDPDLLILDEPTSGLDPIGKIEIREWVQEEKNKGRTIVISSHLLDEMEKVGTKFVVLVRGKIEAQGEIDKITTLGLENYFYNVVKGVENENDN